MVYARLAKLNLPETMALDTLLCYLYPEFAGLILKSDEGENSPDIAEHTPRCINLLLGFLENLSWSQESL